MTSLFKEINVTINGKVKLKGTLALPDEMEKQVPAVLILAGSGPTDRDGNIKKQRLNLNIYKDLSDMIAALGFATLRYDKRGVGESTEDFLKTGMWDLVEDGEAALHFLKSHPQVDPNKLIVLGHSEGCILGTALNAKWHREHFSYDMLEDLKKVECPTLVITGSKDMQANQECVPKIMELVGDNAVYHIIENMNHILKMQEHDPSILQLAKEYKRQSGQPLHPELQHILSEWLQKQYGTSCSRGSY